MGSSFFFYTHLTNMKNNISNDILPIMRDTPFASLMNRRIYNVLLIATPYDAFMLEDDGRVDEEIFNEYASLNLRYPPRFTRVTTQEEALNIMTDRHFELIIIMPNLADDNSFKMATPIKALHPNIPIVMLTPFSKEVKKHITSSSIHDFDYLFSWLGNAELLLAIIKLIEDKMNAPHDVNEVGVQAIVLVEDSVRFYSSALPLLYRTILEQSQKFAKEALNDHLKMLRMRGRPKVLLARNYEEAEMLCNTYGHNLLGVITDISFKRDKQKDSLAGIDLSKALLKSDAHLPIIMQSSDKDNEHFANELGLPFVQKNVKTYPTELHNAIMSNLGFNDFVVTDPITHNELLRIKDLKDLQLNLNNIPDKLLYQHLEQNHISRFLYARAIFPPAEVLRQHNVTQYKDMNEAKAYISKLIDRYRTMKHAGVVAMFHKDNYDRYNNFTRIGKGSLGGKGRGLAFMNAFIKQYLLQHDSDSNIRVDIPKTVIICTDVFDAFMNDNHLYPIALSNASDAEIFDAFQEATLPPKVIEDLTTLLSSIQSPLAIRSSSLLEDSHFQPFAGVYATYMIAPSTQQLMLTNVRAAIKAVYASVFYEQSKNYLNATQNLIDQEKMAIVIQEVVGKTHNTLFYPTLSGVARSYNFYPCQNEKADDGVISIALGLGKQIVDGGKSLRFSPRRPQSPLQTATISSALSETQDTFIALNLQQADVPITINDSYNLKRVQLKDFPLNDTDAPYIFSTYDWQNNRIMPGFYPQMGRAIISFQSLLNHPQLPISNIIDKLMALGKEEMKRDVEIEFAMQLTSNQTANFFLLQIRPITNNNTNNKHLFVDNSIHLNKLIYSSSVLGNLTSKSIKDIIYVKNDHYTIAQSREIAQYITDANATFMTQRNDYLLVGAGRWGSSDPALGIPIRWANIAGVGAIVETEMQHRHIDASQGSHFFQNLTSLGIPYFTLSSFNTHYEFNKEWFDSVPATFENEHIRIIHLTSPLLIVVDGKSQKGFIAIDE